MRVFVYVCVCVRVCAYVCMCVCVCVYSVCVYNKKSRYIQTIQTKKKNTNLRTGKSLHTKWLNESALNSTRNDPPGERVMPHVWTCHIMWTGHVTFMGHITPINEHGTQLQWLQRDTAEWTSHVTRMNESRDMYEWVMSHPWLRHVTRSHWLQRATAGRRSHVTHMKKSRHVYE